MNHFRKRVAQLIFIFGIILLAPRVFAMDTPRKKLMDLNWKFYLGDASDAGTNLDYPEISDLAKTRAHEVGQEGELANVADAATKNLVTSHCVVHAKAGTDSIARNFNRLADDFAGI